MGVSNWRFEEQREDDTAWSITLTGSYSIKIAMEDFTRPLIVLQ